MTSIGGAGPSGSDYNIRKSPFPPLKLFKDDEDDEVASNASSSDEFDDPGSVDFGSLVDVPISPVTVQPTEQVKSALSVIQSELNQVGNLMEGQEVRVEKRMDLYETAATSFDLTQQLASSVSSGASMTAPSPTSGAQTLFVASTSISSAFGVFCTFVTCREAAAMRDLIAIKEQNLTQASKKELENELIQEITDLKKQNSALIGLAVMGAIDSSASTSAFGIQLSGATTQSAGMAANVLGAAASLVGVAVSSYQIFKNIDKSVVLANKLEKANQLYEMSLPEDTDPLVAVVIEDICLLRDSNLTVQRNDLVISNIQNGLVLGGSLLGLAQSLIIIFVSSSSIIVTCLGVGAVIGIGVGVTVGLSYYAYKKRHALRNKFTKLMNFLSNDPKKLALLDKEATYLSALEKFDATYSLINKKIDKIKKRMAGIRQQVADSAAKEELVQQQIQLEKLIKKQTVSVEERLNRLHANMAQIIMKGHGTIYEILLKLGVPENEIEVADTNHMMNQLHKALVS